MTEKLMNEQTRFILFGGGPALYEFAYYLRTTNIPFVIFTDSAHLSEVIGAELTLGTALSRNELEYHKVDQLTVPLVEKFVTKATYGISISARGIFTKELIELFECRLFNCHSSALPKHRGGGGFSWQIMMDSRHGGICIHEVTEIVDIGNVVEQVEFEFPKSCVLPIDYLAYSLKWELKALKRLTQNIVNNELNIVSGLDITQATYWPRLNTDVNGFVDWAWSVKEIDRFVRAFDDPYDGVSTFLGNHRVRLKKSRLLGDPVDSYHPFQAGLIFNISDAGVTVACRGGPIHIRDVTFDLAGNHDLKVRVGDRFHTPIHVIESARTRIKL